VAASPDPDDPEAVAREVYNRKGEERLVDERLDPYSGRFFPKEARTEELARLLRQEAGVERIVRERSWGIVAQRCEGFDVGGKWEDGMAKWRQQQQAREGKR
jgi:Caffeine-induced death protein 2